MTGRAGGIGHTSRQRCRGDGTGLARHRLYEHSVESDQNAFSGPQRYGAVTGASARPPRRDPLNGQVRMPVEAAAEDLSALENRLQSGPEVLQRWNLDAPERGPASSGAHRRRQKRGGERGCPRQPNSALRRARGSVNMTRERRPRAASISVRSMFWGCCWVRTWLRSTPKRDPGLEHCSNPRSLGLEVYGSCGWTADRVGQQSPDGSGGKPCNWKSRSSISVNLTGFQILPQRWVVERTYEWLMKHHRLVRDLETTESSAVGRIVVALLRIMLGRLTCRRAK